MSTSAALVGRLHNVEAQLVQIAQHLGKDASDPRYGSIADLAIAEIDEARELARTLAEKTNTLDILKQRYPWLEKESLC